MTQGAQPPEAVDAARRNRPRQDPAVLAREGDPPEPPGTAANAARRNRPRQDPAVLAREGDPPDPPGTAANAARRNQSRQDPAVLAREGDPPEPPGTAANAARRNRSRQKPTGPARGDTAPSPGHTRAPDGAEHPGPAPGAGRAAGPAPPGDGQGAEPVLLLDPRDGPAALVASATVLDQAVAALAKGEGPVAVDAERASGFRYGHRAFLVQLRRRGAGTILIDPVTCPDLSGLDAALADSEIVLHAASQDLPCLSELGFRPRALFDTELAGRLLGFPRVGLGALVESVLGWTLEKGHAAADWSVRPLPGELLRYAALDVELLVELRDALAVMLAAQGKTEWARQEFAAVLAAKPAGPRPDPWRRTSGIHRVHSRRGLAIVRELWEERDRIARRRDLSPGRVLPDAAIVEAARALPNSQADLTDLPGFQGRGARRHATSWLRAIQRVRGQPEQNLPGPALPPPEGPPPTHRWQERDPVAARRLAAVRTVVAALADEHTVPAENLLPPDVVRRLAWQPPEPQDPGAVAADLAAHGARPWQVELTALPISKALARLAEKGEALPADGAPAGPGLSDPSGTLER